MLLLTDCTVTDEPDPRVGDALECPRFAGRVAFDAYCFHRRRRDVHVARQRRVRAAEHCAAAATTVPAAVFRVFPHSRSHRPF